MLVKRPIVVTLDPAKKGNSKFNYSTSNRFWCGIHACTRGQNHLSLYPIRWCANWNHQQWNSPGRHSSKHTNEHTDLCNRWHIKVFFRRSGCRHTYNLRVWVWVWVSCGDLRSGLFFTVSSCTQAEKTWEDWWRTLSAANPWDRSFSSHPAVESKTWSAWRCPW